MAQVYRSSPSWLASLGLTLLILSIILVPTNGLFAEVTAPPPVCLANDGCNPAPPNNCSYGGSSCINSCNANNCSGCPCLLCRDMNGNPCGKGCCCTKANFNGEARTGCNGQLCNTNNCGGL